MKPWDDVKVYLAAATGLSLPDVASIFQTMGPIFDGLVRLGQILVAIVTAFYIFKKTKALSSRKRAKRTKCEN